MLYERVNGDILKKAKDDEETINDIYDYLDINRPDSAQALFISPKSYSSILKSLYFSSYLTYEDSSKVLDDLAHSTFNDWLPKPIPLDQYQVAHKFGVYDLKEPANYKVHSDCGIVYIPKRPYLLCVMVQHSDSSSETVGTDVTEISKIVYQSVVNQNH